MYAAVKHDNESCTHGPLVDRQETVSDSVGVRGGREQINKQTDAGKGDHPLHGIRTF